MDVRSFVLEIFRETDFVSEAMLSKSMDASSSIQVKQSIVAINKACSAFLNGEDPEPHLNEFLRRQMEADVYEEFEIWGKFSPPPQFIDYGDDDK